MSRRLVEDDDVMPVPEPWTRCCDVARRRVEAERDEARALLHKATALARDEERRRIIAWLRSDGPGSPTWWWRQFGGSEYTNAAEALLCEPCEICRAPATCLDDVPRCFDCYVVLPEGGA